MPLIAGKSRLRRLAASWAAGPLKNGAGVSSRNHDFDASVPGASVGRAVVGNRSSLTLAVDLQSAAVFQQRLEKSSHALGTLDRELIVRWKPDVASADRRIVG